jgi:16S rRNA A1518/A1519 N6-dimethyltransferase RsmA/KsgA/DIM1 with predicted DNA glycosylase/AP lyase activity
VKKAFSERRKMLRNTLQPLYTPQQVGVLGVVCMVASARLMLSTCQHWAEQVVLARQVT